MKKISQIIFIFLMFILSFSQAFGEEESLVIESRGWTCRRLNDTLMYFETENECRDEEGRGCVTRCERIKDEGNEGGEVIDFYLIPNSTQEDRPNGYKLLAPIGSLDFVSYDPGKDNFVGNYLSIIFKLAIGIISALAVIMLIVAGIQYMGEDSIFGKTKAKNQMTNAILGLLIALGSYAILYTISPDLIGDKGLFIKKISIDLPDSGDGTVDQNCKGGKEGSYLKGSPTSPEVTEAVKKIKEEGWGLDSFEVSSEDNKMSIILKKNGEQKEYKIGMSPGTEGYAQVGAGKIEDKKTPKGSWKIVSKEYNGNGLPVFSNSCSNMGASFWLLDPMINGKYRGIGIHGNYSGLLSPTHGCIRLTNSDILALLPYVKVGMRVEIK